ncbi:MAG: peptide-methionine (S)-S-oxide reductase, partial [Rhodoferax sp.]|nr:peptide-methionine (S)-S-oxide reductase [Rhodoferax sp.]
FAIHDPTTRDRQGHDLGPQYRSAIFWHDELQRGVIDAVMAEVDAATGGRVVTQVEPVRNYWRAEDFHQRYFDRNPHQGYCAAVVAPKVEKFRRTFRQRVRAD